MSKFFINRPIVAMVIAILTVIVGAITILGLPISQFPDAMSRRPELLDFLDYGHSVEERSDVPQPYRQPGRKEAPEPATASPDQSVSATVEPT